jgi:mycofactocin glycosyltransferase
MSITPLDATTPRTPPTRIRLHPRTRVFCRGEIVFGGSPWRLSRIPLAQRDVLLALTSGDSMAVTSDHERIAVELLDRGLAIPDHHDQNFNLSAPNAHCTIVIPAFDNPEQLARCLQSVGPRYSVVVVDDGSRDGAKIHGICERFGAQLIIHSVNRGPAAARNTGLRRVETPFVAFLDSDCIADESWIEELLPYMGESHLAVIAPRVVPGLGSGAVARFEATDSALDMGRIPELVRPGSALGYLPSAAMIVRRSVLGDSPFDESLRTGEDVDAVWRISDAGWMVRYEPSVAIHHAGRQSLHSLMARRKQYGESSRKLSARYPERLTPARISLMSALLGLALMTKRPALVAGASAITAMTIARHVRELPEPARLTGKLTALSVASDARALGSLLRREWWPMGAACLAFAPRSHIARLGAAVMIAPVVGDWRSKRSTLDPATYVAMRLVADAAYGTGVIAAAIAAHNPRLLIPRLRFAERRARPTVQKDPYR